MGRVPGESKWGGRQPERLKRTPDLIRGIERLERLERYSLRAGDIRQHRKKHQSQVQTSKALKVDFGLTLNLSFIPYPFGSPLSLCLHPFVFQFILHPFALILSRSLSLCLYPFMILENFVYL